MRCISVDLEVSRSTERIYALAAVNQQTGSTLAFSKEGLKRAALSDALQQLDDFAEQGDCLVGHNLISFDLPHLRAAAPSLGLLRLPALDTLRLSPLAFPANPYHRLVKHYYDGGLVRGQINNPELDAWLALEVLEEQRQALGSAHPDLLTAWHWLTGESAHGQGFDAFFEQLRGSPRPAAAEAHAAIERRLAGNVCRTQDVALLATAQQGLAAGLRAGLALRRRRQFGDAALGAPPVPGGRPSD